MSELSAIQRAIAQLGEKTCADVAADQLLDASKLPHVSIDRLTKMLNNLNAIGSESSTHTHAHQLLLRADAILIMMHILNTPNMPKRIYMESFLSTSIQFIHAHLKTTLTSPPSSDERNDAVQLSVTPNEKSDFVHRFPLLIDLLANLLRKQPIPDLLLFDAIYIGIAPFFTDWMQELRAHTLPLLRTLFLRYDHYRDAIFTDICAHGEQMAAVTELCLHLIQSMGTMAADKRTRIALNAQIKQITQVLKCLCDVIIAANDGRVKEMRAHLVKVCNDVRFPAATWLLATLYERHAQMTLSGVNVHAFEHLSAIAQFYLELLPACTGDVIKMQMAFSGSATDLTEFYALKWCARAPSKQRTRLLGAKIARETTTEADANADLLRAINAHESHRFDTYWTVVEKLLAGTNVQLRVRVLRKLIAFSELNAELVDHPRMRALFDRYHADPSAAIRDCVMELMGRAVRKTGFDHALFPRFAARLNDASTNVTRTVIKTLKSICADAMDAHATPPLLLQILRRMRNVDDDEQLLRKAIVDVFATVWFNTGHSTGLLAWIDLCNETDLELVVAMLRHLPDAGQITVIVKQLLCVVTQADFDQAHVTTVFGFCQIVARTHKVALRPRQITGFFLDACSSLPVIARVADILDHLLPFGNAHEMSTLFTRCTQFVAADTSTDAVRLNCVRLARHLADLIDNRTWAPHYLCTLTEVLRRREGARAAQQRALFLVGAICRQFSACVDVAWAHELTTLALTYAKDDLVNVDVLRAIGDICSVHVECAQRAGVIALYHRALQSEVEVARQVMHNMALFLGAQSRAALDDHDANNNNNIKELDENDASNDLVQQYIGDVKQLCAHRSAHLRRAAILWMSDTWRLRLVHPAQVNDELIVLSCDEVAPIAAKAVQILQEMHVAHPQWTQQGWRVAFRRAFDVNVARADGAHGYRMTNERTRATLANYYAIIRDSTKHRHAMLSLLVNEMTRVTDARYLLYVVNNLAYLPYASKDEALYIVGRFEANVNVEGEEFVRTFRDHLQPKEDVDVDEEDVESVCARLPLEVAAILDCCRRAQGTYFLLRLRDHLKAAFKLTVTDCRRYATNAKAFEKPWQSRGDARFEVALLPDGVSAETKAIIAGYYVAFRDLLLQMDVKEAKSLANSARKEKGKPAAKSGRKSLGRKQQRKRKRPATSSNDSDGPE